MAGRRRIGGKTRTIAPLALACAAVLTVAGWDARPAGAAAPKRLVIYSVAEQEQYVNNSDSRLLGIGNSPFGTFKDSGANSVPRNGPFPGDESLFSFNLYSDSGTRHRIGTATFTCQYDFATNAFCDAAYRLKNGASLIAGGTFSFSATRFSLAVTGGSGRFEGITGTVAEAPSGKHAQKLVFTLTPPPSRSTALSLYAAPGRVSYIDNVDDLARGLGHNPFGNYRGSLATIPKNERAFGPFAGDEANYSFRLFADAAHTRPAGSASFVCQYGFGQGGFCDAALALEQGTLVAKGSYNFNAHAFELAVVGGTGDYRGVRGHLEASALGLGTQVRPVRRGAPMRQAQHYRIALLPAARTTHRLTSYAQPASEAFIANLDDETRGATQNPFGIHLKLQGLSEQKSGPFAGDEALFSFATFSDPNTKTKSGSAVYTCWYAFARNGFCDATYRLKGGTLLAAGTIDFDAPTFSLAVTGGTGRYRDATGNVDAAPKGHTSQKLSFAYRLP